MSDNWVKTMKERVRAGDPEALALVRHGTLTGYTCYGCQCEACTRTMSDYCKERRRRLGLTKGTMPTPEQREAAVEAHQRRGLKAATEETGYSEPAILDWVRAADVDVLARIARLVEEDQRENGRNGIHCPVDGAPMPGARMLTCSPRCAQLWTSCRYHIDEDYKSDHQFRIALWNIEHNDDPITLRHSRRIVAGAEIDRHGSWLISNTQRRLLQEVVDRRAQAKDRWGDLATDLPAIRAMATSG